MSEAGMARLNDKLEETVSILEGLFDVVKQQGEMIRELNERILADKDSTFAFQKYLIDDSCEDYFKDSLDSPLEDPLGGLEGMMTEVSIN